MSLAVPHFKTLYLQYVILRRKRWFYSPFTRFTDSSGMRAHSRTTTDVNFHLSCTIYKLYLISVYHSVEYTISIIYVIYKIYDMSTTLSYQKVLSGRRISIPDSLSKKYGIKEGDLVIIEDDKGIRIIPADVVKRLSTP